MKVERLIIVGAVALCLVVTPLITSACKQSQQGYDTPTPQCVPACDEAHVCCYNFHYETLNPDGGDPSFTYPDAAQEFISTPTCAIPLTRDAGGSGEVNAVEDGGVGVCAIDPPL